MLIPIVQVRVIKVTEVQAGYALPQLRDPLPSLLEHLAGVDPRLVCQYANKWRNKGRGQLVQ
jgi:hypothetical protein